MTGQATESQKSKKGQFQVFEKEKHAYPPKIAFLLDQQVSVLPPQDVYCLQEWSDIPGTLVYKPDDQVSPGINDDFS